MLRAKLMSFTAKPIQKISELWQQTSILVRMRVEGAILNQVQENVRNQFWDQLVPEIRRCVRERHLSNRR